LDLVFTSPDFVTAFFYGEKSSTSHLPPSLEDQVPVFMFLSDRVAQLYPQLLGSLVFAFYVSQATVEVILSASIRGSMRLIGDDNPDINLTIIFNQTSQRCQNTST
jgi:hypothetical protein